MRVGPRPTSNGQAESANYRYSELSYAIDGALYRAGRDLLRLSAAKTMHCMQYATDIELHVHSPMLLV